MKDPDKTCVPCRRKTLYWVLVTPILLAVILVFIGLWRFSPLLSFIFLGIWLLANVFEGYCCADLQCPYVGKWCHPVGGFLLSSLIYKIFFFNRLKKSKEGLNMFMELSSTAIILVLIVFPIFWLIKLSLIYAIAYPTLWVVYAIAHICLICAICPVGQICFTSKIRNKLCRGEKWSI